MVGTPSDNNRSHHPEHFRQGRAGFSRSLPAQEKEGEAGRSEEIQRWQTAHNDDDALPGNYIWAHTHVHCFAFCVQPRLNGRRSYNKWQSIFTYLTVQPRLNEKPKPLYRASINLNLNLDVNLNLDFNLALHLNSFRVARSQGVKVKVE